MLTPCRAMAEAGCGAGMSEVSGPPPRRKAGSVMAAMSKAHAFDEKL